MSNQVELAEEEDPTVASKTFNRGISYRHVTEEESQARRDRKVVLGIYDDRDSVVILKGLGLILDHMVKTCISRGLCPPEAEEGVRGAWFDYLTAISDHSDEHYLMARIASGRLVANMAKWGIRTDYRDIVTKDLSKERRKQIQGLHELLDDRKLSSGHIFVYEESPFYIYAHDWLCLFLDLTQFPIPDWILQEFSTRGVSWKLISAIRKQAKEVKLNPVAAALSLKERRKLVRKIFVDIMSSTEIREKHGGIKETSQPKIIDGPCIDMETLLSVLIVGLRRVHVGVLPIHILNWIAKRQLPFYSAHKCLSAPIDRLEYYRVKRTSHAYRRSVFAVLKCPSVEDLVSTLATMEKLGIDTKIRDPMELLSSCLAQLGLGALENLCRSFLTAVLTNEDEKVFLPIESNKKSISTLLNIDYLMDRDYLVGELETNEVVLACIAVAMKLTFPDLHVGSSSEEFFANELEEPLTYEIMSRPASSLSEGLDINWWKTLSGNQKLEFLQFIENECFDELRESLVDDFREQLHPLDKPLYDGPAGDTRRTIMSGKLKCYVKYSGALSQECETLQLVLKDLAKVCQVSRIFLAFRAIRQLESLIFDRIIVA